MNITCEGELRQVHSGGDLQLAEANYLGIIEAKTAELRLFVRASALRRAPRTMRPRLPSLPTAATSASHFRSPTTCLI